jgi:two-component system, LuxR family, sensor kinase FixL
MSTGESPPVTPTTSDTARQDRSAPLEPAAALHGRLLNVSRMATIGEMAAGIARELNQPLTAIAYYAQACERLVTRRDADVSNLQEALHQITAQSTRAAEIIRRLRALARSHEGEHAHASANELVTELEELVQADARVRGVRISLDLAPQLPGVNVDAGQIQQVVLNFVRNSLDALVTRPTAGPEIVIRTSLSAESEVELAVIDNGPGLPPEVVHLLFDPFFSTKENGTGLGLAISNTIARAHKGTVGYRPNEPSGACFYILLPTHPRD